MQGGKHSAAAYTELEKWAYGSAVASLDSFVASAGTGMNINISTGAGIISDTIARRIGTDAVETAAVPTASASFARIDTLIAYIDTAVSPTTTVTDNTNNILKFVIVAGTASASPAAPTNSAIVAAIGAGKPYMVLYDILVPQNATNTSSMTLTDRRTQMQLPQTAAQKRAAQTDWLDLTALTTLTYTSYNSTNKVGVLGSSKDITAYVQRGDRIKFSQTTGGTKYGIIQKVTSTQVTVYFGTDFSLANETITAPTFSKLKSPQGFDTNPSKWTREYSDTVERILAGPVNNVWYNNGAPQLAVGVGVWRIWFYVQAGTSVSGSSRVDTRATLSTTNNSETDPDMTTNWGNMAQYSSIPATKEKVYDLASDTLFYLNTGPTSASGAVNLYSENQNGPGSKMFIRAVNALL